ncbi:MAG: hypothetical protein IPO40_24425 [Fibrobacteres bacterium]|nr:hypothetical protein [Fibrobacterota bacterium]
MATLTIKITAPVASFNTYANELGYQATIAEGMDAELKPIMIANPQTKAQYLTEKIKGIVAVALAEKSTQAIRQAKENEARTEATTARTAIEGAMTVTIA